MYYKRLLTWKDTILLDLCIKNCQFYEHISIKDLDYIISHANKDDISKCYMLWLMKPSTKLELYRRTGLLTFNNDDTKYLMSNVEEDEYLDILRKTKLTGYCNMLEKAVDNRWDNVIRYISRNYNIIYEVSDENVMQKLQYAMNISPNIHISLRTVEMNHTPGDFHISNLHNVVINDITTYNYNYITIPLRHTVEDYKIMISNWKILSHKNIKPTCTNAHNKKYLHHILFELILGVSVRPHGRYKFKINTPVLDYLAHEYPNSIYKLWITFPNNHTLRRLCALYFPSYLDRNKVDGYCKYYHRMHIIITNMFTDITIIDGRE